jgi:hypothetical protein
MRVLTAAAQRHDEALFCNVSGKSFMKVWGRMNRQIARLCCGQLPADDVLHTCQPTPGTAYTRARRHELSRPHLQATQASKLCGVTRHWCPCWCVGCHKGAAALLLRPLPLL